MNMLIRFIPFVIFMAILISCEFESGMNIDEKQYKHNLFLYNINDSSSQFISEGFNPIILNNSKRVLYKSIENKGLWIYDIGSGQNIKIIDEYISEIDDNSISPDEKYLVFRKKHKILTLNLITYEVLELINSEDILNFSSEAKFSYDGSQLIYISCPYQKNDFSNFDSVYVHIYDFSTKQSLTLDTLFNFENARYGVSFTKGSQNFYVVQSRGYDYDMYENRHEINLYTNTDAPMLVSNFTIYRSTGWDTFWNVNDEEIVYFELEGIYHFTLRAAKLINKYSFPVPLELGSMRLIKNTSMIVAADSGNVINFMSVQGSIMKSFKNNVEGYITGIDYSESLEKIVFSVEVELEN